MIGTEELQGISALGGIREVYSSVKGILEEHGIKGNLFSEREISALENRELLFGNGMSFNFDTGKSVAANLTGVFNQAAEIQKNSGGANFVGAMLQHLVGAKLDIVLGVGKIGHHGFSVADSPTQRNGDFDFKDVSIHVTTHPSEALIRKTAANLGNGIKPIIVTLAEGVEGAAYLLKNTEWKDRVDVIDATQFLTANVYEHSLFEAADCRVTLDRIFTRYNEIVSECETDPVLKIRL